MLHENNDNINCLLFLGKFFFFERGVFSPFSLLEQKYMGTGLRTRVAVHVAGQTVKPIINGSSSG
jgi:hypothetical protein